MSHAKGSNFKLVCGFETVFNTVPDPATGLVLPVNSVSLRADQPLKTSGTIFRGRNPSEPNAGFVSVSGDVAVPMEASGLGFWLTCLLGQPVTTQAAAKNIAAGPAVNKGGGKVGIPVTAHGIAAGVTVTVAGTTSYNGEYVVDKTSTVNEIVITHAYTAETFSSGTVRPKIYTHVYGVPDEAPSFFSEKQFTDIVQHEMITGCKVQRFGTRVGGDGELVATVGVEGCNAMALSSTSLVDTEVELSLARFLFDGVTIHEAGSAYGKAKEFSLDIGADLDTDSYFVGGGGMRGSLAEGVMSLGGTMKAVFDGPALLEKGRAHTDTSIVLSYSRAVESLSFEFQEVQISRTSPPMDTPRGLYCDVNWQAFLRGSSGSAVTATLVNQVSGY